MMRPRPASGSLRFLFLSLDFPFPANNGHRMRNWALLRSLAAEGHDVSLLTFAPVEPPSQSAMDRVREVCSEIATVPFALAKASGGSGYMQAIRALFSSVPYGVSRFRSAEMRSKLSALLESRRFDAVICETCYPLVNFPAALSIPLILDNHNLEHVLVERYSHFERNPVKRAYAELEWRKMRAWERNAWMRADRVVVCSEHDQVLCSRLAGGIAASVIPNTLDVEDYQFGPRDDEPTILYVGGMDWFPNRDAVEYFATQIFPLILAETPACRFIVLGRAPSPSFRERFTGLPRVEFIGNVPDVRPHIARAAVCVVPLRIGSGTRFKILEGAVMGKPIVSTTLGAEGLGFVDGKELLLADDPKGFASAVTALLNSPALRRQLGEAGRQRVERSHGLASLRRAVTETLAACELSRTTPETAYTVPQAKGAMK